MGQALGTIVTTMGLVRPHLPLRSQPCLGAYGRRWAWGPEGRRRRGPQSSHRDAPMDRGAVGRQGGGSSLVPGEPARLRGAVLPGGGRGGGSAQVEMGRCGDPSQLQTPAGSALNGSALPRPYSPPIHHCIPHATRVLQPPASWCLQTQKRLCLCIPLP